MRFEICKPAASSFAEFILNPEASLLYDVSSCLVDLASILWELIDDVFVCTYKAMIFLLSFSPAVVIFMNYAGRCLKNIFLCL